MLSDYILPIDALLAFFAFVSFCVAVHRRSVVIAQKSELKTLSQSLDAAISERHSLENRLNENLALLSSAKTRLNSISSEYDQMMRSFTSMQNELQYCKKECRNLADSVIRVNREKSCLEKQLDDLGKQYNELYSIWTESQLVGIENYAIVSQAMVYVGSSGIYHTRVHGSANWREYRLIPLSEALALRYRPCSICVPSMTRKE